jgi:uncharacterized membrane protein YedE/YeeE
MTGTAPRSSSSAPGRAVAAPPTSTRWVGWILFAATMMVLLGALHAIEGLLALLNDQYYQVGKNGLAVHVSYTVWGWTHLVVGAVVVAAGVGLVKGRTWARVVGVAVACVSLLLNVAFMAAFPVYAAILITFDVLVIWAITVHGSEITSAV